MLVLLLRTSAHFFNIVIATSERFIIIVFTNNLSNIYDMTLTLFEVKTTLTVKKQKKERTRKKKIEIPCNR